MHLSFGMFPFLIISYVNQCCRVIFIWNATSAKSDFFSLLVVNFPFFIKISSVLFCELAVITFKKITPELRLFLAYLSSIIFMDDFILISSNKFNRMCFTSFFHFYLKFAQAFMNGLQFPGKHSYEGSKSGFFLMMNFPIRPKNAHRYRLRFHQYFHDISLI